MIEVRNLYFAYDKQPIFKDLSFTLTDFSAAALLGLNGEGKTTLIRLILGLLKPDSGQILIDDKDINTISERERAKLLAYVPQENDDSLQMSVSDFICLGGIADQNIFKGPDINDRDQAFKILKDLGAEELYQQKIEKLSSGQRRLIYLARAIFQRSQIIVMDEPVSSLDLIRQHSFLNWLKDYSLKEKRQIIMSIHDPSLAYDYADTFLFFRNHQLYDLTNKKDPHFLERLNDDIAVLYDHRVDTRFIDDRLYLNWIK